jgi:RimJ/RimL family protein N-acetyltransferase
VSESLVLPGIEDEIRRRRQNGGVIDRSDLGVVAETGRILVRPWRVEEVDRFVDIYRRPEVIRWFSAAPRLERQEAAERIEQSLAQLAVDSRFGRWAIVDRSSAIPVGTIILRPLPDGDGEVEIGWHLHPDSWGKGFASEAARAVLRHGFAGGVPEVWAVTDVENHRSAAVCRRIGMRLLGITHRWYHEPSLMFWVGARDGQEPSLAPDRPAPLSSGRHRPV